MHRRPVRLDDGAMLRAVVCTLALAAVAPSQRLQTYVARNGTFQLDLPATWRELAPSEARTIGAMAGAPKELGYVEPRSFYAVGPVDEWLQGRFDTPWLWVVEQGNEWLIGDDFAGELATMWRERGAATGVSYELQQIGREPVGPDRHEVLTAQRTATPREGPAVRCLDLHAPTGGRQVSLSFTSPLAAWDRWQPEFRRWIATLRFARSAQGTPDLSDRVWTPLLTGAAVSLLLLLLYKRTRRRS